MKIKLRTQEIALHSQRFRGEVRPDPPGSPRGDQFTTIFPKSEDSSPRPPFQHSVSAPAPGRDILDPQLRSTPPPPHTHTHPPHTHTLPHIHLHLHTHTHTHAHTHTFPDQATDLYVRIQTDELRVHVSPRSTIRHRGIGVSEEVPLAPHPQDLRPGAQRPGGYGGYIPPQHFWVSR